LASSTPFNRTIVIGRKQSTTSHMVHGMTTEGISLVLDNARTAHNVIVRPADDACRSVIPGYTRFMKTAISVPDEIFNQVGRRAAELGISRSEFFARAARKYLDELADSSLTGQIDAALMAAADDDSGRAAAAAGRAFLRADDEW
jgi:hypothetical protein